MDIIDQARITQKQTYEAVRNGTQLPEVQAITSEIKQEQEEVETYWPETINKAAYYGIAGELIRLIEPHTESDSVALLGNLLTSFGSVIGSNAYFLVEASKHPARLFIVLVGETSKGRKGTSWNQIRNIFEIIDPEWKLRIQSGLSSGEGAIWAVRDEIIKAKPKKQGATTSYEQEIVDEGVKDKRLLLVESEFASVLRVLGRDGNTLSAIIRNAWDSGDLQSLTKNSQARATGAHISIIGHITKDELLRYLTTTEAGNGFGNRILWFCTKRSKVLPFGGKIHEVNFNNVIEQFREIVSYAKNVEEIAWAEETRPIWEHIYPSLSEGKQGMFGSLTGRAEAYVTRLACIYALLDKSTVIRPLHLKAALAVWDYVEASVRYIFRDITGNKVADEIVEALQNAPDGLTRTDISQFFNKHKTSEEISNALDFLSGIGKITKQKVESEGRYAEVISLVYKDHISHNSHTESYIEKVQVFFPEQDTLPISNL